MSENLTEAELEDLKALNKKDPSELSDSEKTSKIKLSIKRRYDSPEWSLAFELTSPNGRRADAIAVNTFPSRNFKVVGFEFKASRSDWLSEKNEGAKADYFVTACDEWYVVAWSGVVKEKELPEGWGLLELKPNSEQIWTQVESNLTKHQQGEPDKAFWGRFIQKTVGGESNYTQQDLNEARKRGYEKAKDEAVDRHVDRETKKLRDKANSYEKIKDSGLDLGFGELSDERVERLNKAQKLIRQIEGDNYGTVKQTVEQLRKDAERHYEDVVESSDELEQVLDEMRDNLVGDVDE